MCKRRKRRGNKTKIQGKRGKKKMDEDRKQGQKTRNGEMRKAEIRRGNKEMS